MTRVSGVLSLTTQRLAFRGRMGRESHFVWLKDIVAVRPIDPFPQIGVVLTSGEAHHYFVLTSRATAPLRSSSHPARDAAIRHIMAVAKSGGPPPMLA